MPGIRVLLNLPTFSGPPAGTALGRDLEWVRHDFQGAEAVPDPEAGRENPEDRYRAFEMSRYRAAREGHTEERAQQCHGHGGSQREDE